MNETEHLIIYHAGCMDGFASAWVVWHALLEQGYTESKMQFIACDYGDPIPDMTGKRVYIVDFSWYDTEALLAKVFHAKAVWMMDHHIGAQRAWGDVPLPTNFRYIYNKELSGLGITWNYFYPDEQMFQHRMLARIQDRDLWRFELDGSREIHARLKSEGFLLRESNQVNILEKFNRFDRFFDTRAYSTDTLIYEGRIIQRAELALIDLILERTMKLVDFPIYAEKGDGSGDLERVDTVRVPMAEMPYDLASEAGNKMAIGYPFSITYETQHALGKRKFSVRSEIGEGMDVSAVSVQNGGGGHEHSGGWYGSILDTEEFPWD